MEFIGSVENIYISTGKYYCSGKKAFNQLLAILALMAICIYCEI